MKSWQRALDRRVGLSPASSIWIVVRASACNASVDEDDKTVEKWETRMTRVGVQRQRQRQGHTEMKCTHVGSWRSYVVNPMYLWCHTLAKWQKPCCMGAWS